MLGQRVFRFIAVVVLAVLTLVAVYMLLFWILFDLLGGIEALGAVPNESARSEMMGGLIFSFAICVVNQFLGDFLNFGFLDNAVGKFIKRVIFFAVVIVALFFAVTIHFQHVEDTNISYGGLGFFAFAFYQAVVLGPVASTFLCCMATADDWEKEGWPFLPLIGWAMGAVVGIVLAFLRGVEFISSYGCVIVGGLALVALVIYMIKVGWPYSFVGLGFGGGGSYSSGSSSYSGSSYSGGSSYGSSGSSGRSSSSSSYYTEEVEQQDYRKSDGFFFNSLQMDMYRITRSRSCTHTLPHSVDLRLDILESTDNRGVRFTINGKLVGGYITDQSDVNDVQNAMQSVLQDVANSLVSDAESAVDRAREKYNDYDREFNISVKVGRISA